MLRITLGEDEGMWVRLLLEGRIAGPWASALDLECRRLLERGVNVMIDFQGVSSVDEEGFAVLRALPAASENEYGVSVTNETVFVRHRMAGGLG